jgi:hypothetical protein
MKRLLYFPLFLLALATGALEAQTSPTTQPSPTTIAVFPLKNLGGEAVYDSLGWKYADSLVAYLNTKENAGKVYSLISMDDLRDQLLAQNVDPRSPSYETDMWRIAKLLGARRLVWGTYLVKYEKASIDLKIYDAKTVMADMKNFADKLRAPYTDALSTVTAGGDKLLPGLK